MIEQNNTPSESSNNTDANEPTTPVVSTPPNSWSPAETSPATSSTEPTPPAPAPVAISKPSKKNSLWCTILVVLALVLIAAAGALGYSVSKKKADKDSTALKSQITALQSNAHELPAGAIKVSDCIPNMGSHYLPKGADPEYGPFVLVTKAGKVIGLEYMAAQDMYTAIPKTDPPVQLITKDSPLYGWKFDHIEFSHLPKGHEGLLKDHTDVHLFTVPSDEVAKSCV